MFALPSVWAIALPSAGVSTRRLVGPAASRMSKYRRAFAEKCRVVQDRLQRIFGHGEGYDGRRVTVDDGVDVRPHLVDLAVDETLLVGAAPLRIDRLAVEVVLHDVVRRDRRRRDRARHQIAIWIAGIADADMTEAIEDLFVREDTVGEHQIFDGGGIDAGKRARSGLSSCEGKRHTDRQRGHERKACLRRHGFFSQLGQRFRYR